MDSSGLIFLKPESAGFMPAGLGGAGHSEPASGILPGEEGANEEGDADGTLFGGVLGRTGERSAGVTGI